LRAECVKENAMGVDLNTLTGSLLTILSKAASIYIFVKIVTIICTLMRDRRPVSAISMIDDCLYHKYHLIFNIKLAPHTKR
jgi:hypothetical protein